MDQIRIAVDLFSGSGGVTAGLKAAGWNVIAAVDNDPIAAATYRLNHPEVTFVQESIEASSVANLLSIAINSREVDLLVICAPCQPFSSQNRLKGKDPRKNLLLKSLELVPVVNPALIFFENVPGLASAGYQYILDAVRERLTSIGYLMADPIVKDAADFGVPQRRRRCIMLAAQKKSALEAFASLDLRQPRRVVQDAIGDLVELENGGVDPLDPLHAARSHSDLTLQRLRNIPKDGGSRKSLPVELRLKCHKEWNVFPDVYGRMSWNSLAPTLTTGCTDVTKGRFAHPEQDRAITSREAARLQTFDDAYQFTGNRFDVARQIGNAVPPRMIAQLVRGFEAALGGHSCNVS